MKILMTILMLMSFSVFAAQTKTGCPCQDHSARSNVKKKKELNKIKTIPVKQLKTANVKKRLKNT